MNSLSRFLVGQGWVAPAALGLIMVLSLFEPGYSSIGQHMSELILGSPLAQTVIRGFPMITGTSITLFSVGLALKGGRWSALVTLAFGIAMTSAGIAPMGSPWHGMYGLAIMSVLVPAFYCLEFDVSPRFQHASLAVSVLSLIYMWFLLVGLDPADYRGLTQRAHSAWSFGWLAFAAFAQHSARGPRLGAAQPA